MLLVLSPFSLFLRTSSLAWLCRAFGHVFWEPSFASSWLFPAIAHLTVDQIFSFQRTLYIAFHRLLVIWMRSHFSFAFDSYLCISVDNALIKGVIWLICVHVCVMSDC